MSHSDAAPRPVVGFIGLGDQGLPMAQAIADAGFVVHSWARRPEILDDPRLAALTRHPSAADLAAHVDILAVCISTDTATIDLAASVMPAMRPGAIFVNHGTGTPANATALAELGKAHGVHVLDAPVTGGRPAAEAHTLTTLVGGEGPAAARSAAMFESFSARVVHLGGTGAGQRAKLFNNALLMLNLQSIADVLLLAKETGNDTMALVDALRSGSAASRALDLLGTMIQPDTAEHLAELLALDMDIFATAMREEDVSPAVTERVITAGLAGARRLQETAELFR